MQKYDRKHKTHYLDRKKWFIRLINKAKIQTQIGCIEYMVMNMYRKQVIEQTGEWFIADSHTSDLLKLCLLKRCEIIASSI